MFFSCFNLLGLWLVISLMLGVCSNASAQSSSAELLAEIESLRTQQQQTLAKLDQLEAALLQAGTNVKMSEKIITNPNKKADVQQSSLTFWGDARIRAESNWYDGSANRERLVVRARLRTQYQVNNNIKFGGEILTGDLDDPNTADVTLSNYDNDIAVGLSQLYVQADIDSVTYWAGKFSNPLYKTDIVWDSDVNPQGVAATYRFDLNQVWQGKMTGIGMIIDERTNASDSTMAGLQIFVQQNKATKVRWLAALSYYDYSLNSLVGADSGDIRSNRIDGDQHYLSDFNLLEIHLGLSLASPEPQWPITLGLNVVENLGAVDEQSLAYLASIEIGSLEGVDQKKIRLAYHEVEKDAVFAAFSHDNFDLATDYRALELGFDYRMAASLLFSFSWYHYQGLNEQLSTTSSAWRDRLRFNLTTHF